jgi:RNA polymerase-associated protein RTF1
MDMETSDEEEEDGQISKMEQEEEKERKLLNKQNPGDEPITLEDLNKCRLTRDMLAKNCMAPWFEDYVKGMVRPVHIRSQSRFILSQEAWVRYLIGQENGQPVYRICEISSTYYSSFYFGPSLSSFKTLRPSSSSHIR